MKLWTNNTNAVTVVDDNKLWPRCSYILPDELVNPPFNDAIPVPHLIKPYYTLKHPSLNPKHLL